MGLKPDTAECLKRYLDVRTNLREGQFEPALFLTRFGQRPTARCIRNIVVGVSPRRVRVSLPSATLPPIESLFGTGCTPRFLQDFNRWVGTKMDVIYFVQRLRDMCIKIGFSGSFAQRWGTLQREEGVPLALLALVPGTKARERKLQHLFGADHVSGEWFRPSDRLMACIERFRE